MGYTRYPSSGSGSGVTSIGILDSQTPSADGAVIASTSLVLQSASISVPGLINNTTQSISGVKTFTNGIATSSLSLTGAVSIIGSSDVVQVTIKGNATQTSDILDILKSDNTNLFKVTNAGAGTFAGALLASNLSGSNTGDVTLAAVGSSPSANGASLSGQVLTLQPATASFPGALTAADWTTFNNKQAAGNYITALTSDVTASGPGSVAATVAKIQGTTVSGTTGNTNVVFSNAPTLVAPTLGAASATTLSMGGAINLNSHLINNVTDPSSAQDAATKAYVDAAIAALQPLTSVYAASVANIPGTYLNGVAGVGATFTTTATTAFALDGVSPPVSSRVLIKDQSGGNGFQNGVYQLTTQAVGGVSGAILTRTSDYNTANDMNAAGLIPVINGTVNALSSWQQTATITTVGVDLLVFQEFTANPSLYLLKANNLSDVAAKATAFDNLSPMTAGGDLIYGGASGTGTRLANGSAGQFLKSNGTTLAPSWAAVGTVTSVALSTPNGLDISGSPVTSAGTLALTNRALNAQSGSYTLTATDSIVSFSATADATLPTAVSASGTLYTIANIGAASLITLKTTSAQTISGNASGALILSTQYETIQVQSDGANWIIVNHKCNTSWSNSLTWTPNSAYGTISNPDYRWRRLDDSMEAELLFTLGTATGSVAKIALPAGFTINSAKFPATQNVFLGPLIVIATSGSPQTIPNRIAFYNGSDAGNIYIAVTTRSNTIDSAGGSDIFQNGDTAYLKFTIPITGWFA